MRALCAVRCVSSGLWSVCVSVWCVVCHLLSVFVSCQFLFVFYRDKNFASRGGKRIRVVCLLFFDDRIFFDVPLGQVSCGCDEVGWTSLVHGRLRYWVILLFVRHPAARGGWTLE